MQPLINELLSLGYSVKLVHVPNETSMADVEEHGYICLKSSAGDELVRRGGFQHNRKLRAGGSWDPKAVEEVCECAKKGVPLAAGCQSRDEHKARGCKISTFRRQTMMRRPPRSTPEAGRR